MLYILITMRNFAMKITQSQWRKVYPKIVPPNDDSWYMEVGERVLKDSFLTFYVDGWGAWTLRNYSNRDLLKWVCSEEDVMDFNKAVILESLNLN